MEPIGPEVDSTPSPTPSNPRTLDVASVAAPNTPPPSDRHMTTGEVDIKNLEAGTSTDVSGSSPAEATVTALDAGTPITNLYLTFMTPLPTPNVPEGTRELPPQPDLSGYTDPYSWTQARKMVMVAVSCIATCITAYTAGAYSPGVPLIAAELGVSHEVATVGITTFTLGFAVAPMVLAPLSEINGRYPVFVVAGVVFVVFQAACGLVTTLAGMLVARFFLGCGGSVFSTMIGGVIADLWDKEGRNLPMALYSGWVLIGTGLGPLAGSLIAQEWGTDGQRWKWIFWHQVIIDGVVCIAVMILFRESRGSVLLSRKAKKLNQWYEQLEAEGVFGAWVLDETKHHHGLDTALRDVEKSEDVEKGGASRALFADMESRGYKLQRIRWMVKEDEQRTSVVRMMSVALWRPIHMLFTEPVVFFFSLWVSFAWAILYLTFGSIPLVMQRQYNFDTRQSGLVFISLTVGAVIATVIGIYQEEMLKHPKWQRKASASESDENPDRAWGYVRRRFPAEAPESRLYFTCVTSILLPIGLYLFGFGSQPSIHWIVPCIAIVFAVMGIFAIYLATFNYLADAYQSYASSALAAQSFCRNLLGGAFPLIVSALFTNVGDFGAGGILGSIALALTVVPWVLVFFGEKIRSRSKFAVSLENA